MSDLETSEKELKKPQCWEYEGNDYYLANDLKQYDPDFFKGCRKVRDIIQRKDLDEDDYIYIKEVGDEWEDSDEKCPRAKVAITKAWVKENYPKLMKNNHMQLIPICPERVFLDEKESLVVGGKDIDIKMVGNRTPKGLYIRVRDLSRELAIPSMRDNILQGDSVLQKDMDYFFFTEKCPGNTRESSCKTMEELYITYNGFIRYIMRSRTHTPIVENFREWVTNILFTHQLGTEEQKYNLAASLVDISANTLKNVLNKEAQAVPCIYLFKIGNVKDLRDKMNLPNNYKDENMILKYGRTDDLKRRVGEHVRNFQKINKDINLSLVYMARIDCLHASEAEKEAKDYFEERYPFVDYNKMEELICVGEKDIKDIEILYKGLSKKYSGHITDLEEEIKQKDNALIVVKKEKENEIIISRKDNELELAKKDMEIMKLKAEKEMEISKVRERDLQLEIMKKEMELSKREAELLKREMELVRFKEREKDLLEEISKMKVSKK